MILKEKKIILNQIRIKKQILKINSIDILKAKFESMRIKALNITNTFFKSK